MDSSWRLWDLVTRVYHDADVHLCGRLRRTAICADVCDGRAFVRTFATDGCVQVHVEFLSGLSSGIDTSPESSETQSPGVGPCVVLRSGRSGHLLGSLGNRTGAPFPYLQPKGGKISTSAWTHNVSTYTVLMKNITN